MKRPAIAWAILLSISISATLAAEEGDEPPAWPPPPVELVILGTFHFADPGLDSYRPQHEVNVLAAERQAELAELVERLASFRPF